MWHQSLKTLHHPQHKIKLKVTKDSLDAIQIVISKTTTCMHDMMLSYRATRNMTHGCSNNDIPTKLMRPLLLLYNILFAHAPINVIWFSNMPSVQQARTYSLVSNQYMEMMWFWGNLWSNDDEIQNWMQIHCGDVPKRLSIIIMWQL